MKTKTRAKRTPKDKPWTLSLTFVHNRTQHDLMRQCLEGDQSAIDVLGAIVAPLIVQAAKDRDWLGYPV